ncbi:MAG: hypothetical protein JWP89_5664 [Schlesneria sp.]|nr:hypothetical protein [Schlesneria sp.]
MSCRWISRCVVVLLLLAELTGCGGGHVAGGTRGTLHAGSVLLGDIQVTVHRVDGAIFDVVGAGITRADGRFDLVQPGARSALHLSPGEYRVTLESVGAVPLWFAHEYYSAKTSPLHVNWTIKSLQLDLDIPLPVAGR